MTHFEEWPDCGRVVLRVLTQVIDSKGVSESGRSRNRANSGTMGEYFRRGGGGGLSKRRGSSQLGGFLQARTAVGVADEPSSRLEAQVADRGGRHVDEDAFAFDLVVADVAAHHPADAVQPAPLPAVGDRRLQLAD